MQCSVAAGSEGATGKGAKNPLMASLLNDRLFSPAPVKGVGEKEKRNLKQVKFDGEVVKVKCERSKDKRLRQKQQCNYLFLANYDYSDVYRHIQESYWFIDLNSLTYGLVLAYGKVITLRRKRRQLQ